MSRVTQRPGTTSEVSYTANPDRLLDEEIAPPLAVEILSPGQAEATMAGKLADYASIGIDEVRLVDPTARFFAVLAPDGDRYRPSGRFNPGDRVRSAALPGLVLPVDAAFS